MYILISWYYPHKRWISHTINIDTPSSRKEHVHQFTRPEKTEPRICSELLWPVPLEIAYEISIRGTCRMTWFTVLIVWYLVSMIHDPWFISFKDLSCKPRRLGSPKTSIYHIIWQWAWPFCLFFEAVFPFSQPVLGIQMGCKTQPSALDWEDWWQIAASNGNPTDQYEHITSTMCYTFA